MASSELGTGTFEWCPPTKSQPLGTWHNVVHFFCTLLFHFCVSAEDVPLCSHNMWKSHFPFISKVLETLSRLSFACNYQLPNSHTVTYSLMCTYSNAN